MVTRSQVAFWLLLGLAAIALSPDALNAQGPGPVGLKQANMVTACPEPASVHRITSRASRKGSTLIGAIIGGLLGAYVGNRTANDRNHSADGLGKLAYYIYVPLGIGLGAFVGYIAGDKR